MDILKNPQDLSHTKSSLLKIFPNGSDNNPRFQGDSEKKIVLGINMRRSFNDARQRYISSGKVN
jgi:hypothetical protein